MPLSPAQTLGVVIRLRVNGRELTREHGIRLGRLRFEETEDRDDQVEIDLQSVVGDRFVDLVDDPDLQEGNSLTVQFGYPDRMSREVTGVLVDPRYDFLNQTVTLIARDKGVALHGQASQQVWRNVTHAQIALEIANRHGLAADITPTFGVVESEPQQNRSDFDFFALPRGPERLRLFRQRQRGLVLWSQGYWKRARSDLSVWRSGKCDHELQPCAPRAGEQGPRRPDHRRRV